MKLVDSSAWIEYYRKNGSYEHKLWVSEAIQSNLAAINGVIQVEILAFTRTRSEYDAISSDFSALHELGLDEPVFRRASEVGFGLRRKGITIPGTDLIVAACAMVSDAELIHFDTHYEHIAGHYPLRIVSRLDQHEATTRRRPGS